MSPSLSTTAYAVLKRAVLTNELAPNTFASDRELCERYALSRTPVREAVLRLRDERLLEVVPRKGVRVLPLRVDDVREIHQIIKALEREAASLIASRAPTRDDLADVEGAVAAMERAVGIADREAWVAADARFHLGVVAACGNGRLADTYHGLRGITDRARHFALYLRELPARSTTDHRHMLEAVLAGDRLEIDRLYHEHWDRTTDELVALLERHARVDPVNSAGAFA